MGIGGNFSSGDDNLNVLLRLISDEGNFTTRLQQLKQAEDDAKAATDLVAPAQDIVRIRGEVEGELSEAKASRERAELEAEKLLSEARAQSALTITEAQATADDILRVARAAEAASLERRGLDEKRSAEARAEVSFITSKLNAREAELSKREASLKEREAAIQAQEDILSERALALGRRVEAVLKAWESS